MGIYNATNFRKNLMINKILNQKATAIITAILIVSVISIAAITMQGYLYGELNRTQMIIDNDNLLNNLYGIEAVGLSKLTKFDPSRESDQNISAKPQQRNNIDSILEINHLNQHESVEIQNQNSFFNINYLYNSLRCNNKESNLNQKTLEKVFINIASGANTGLVSNDVAVIVANIQKWMCSKPLLDVEEITDYSGKPVAPAWSYQPAGQFFVDISELRLIPGVTEKFYVNMRDKLTTFPIESKNNNVQVTFAIDNISADLLAALAGADKIDALNFLDTIKDLEQTQRLEKIKQFISEQKKHEQNEIQEINTMLSADNKQDLYYKIISKARIGKYEIHMQTLVSVDSKNTIHVLWRKRGIING